MSTLKSDTLINPMELFDISQSVANSSKDSTNLGGLATTGDGRYFRYAVAGATALVPGKLQQSPVEVTTLEDLTPTATAIGATSITAGSSLTVAANALAGGWVFVTVTPGQGYQYQIVANDAASSSAVTVYLADPIVVALTTSSRIDIVPNVYNGVIVNPATATGFPVGVAVAATPAAYYGWLQVRGVANVLADGAVVVGTNVVASNATAGAVEAATGVQAAVGIAVTAISTTEYGAVNLLLN